jgi:hypothetical protein
VLVAEQPSDADFEPMKSERMTRKSLLKRHPPVEESAVCDLTRPEYENSSRPLMHLGDDDETDPGRIAAMPLAFTTPVDIFEWCAAMASESPTANAMWADAEIAGWSVAMDDLKTGGFTLDMDNRHIVLDHFTLSPPALGRSTYFRNTLLCSFMRALRDIWHENVFGAFETVYLPEDVLMLERARAADCDTVAMLVAWELRGAGHADVWRHVIGSAEGDMALTFTRFLERDPSAVFDGAALAYAFRQWYVDEGRVNTIDHETLESLDVCFAGAEQGGDAGGKRLSGAMLEALSELPDGARYLHGLGERIKNDPFFSGLHDEINQTHLFHLMYDMEVVMVNNVPFRDHALARLIFPDGSAERFSESPPAN